MIRTREERIEAMAREICTDHEADICKLHNGLCNLNCPHYDAAERLYEAGYGDISEYEREIERLNYWIDGIRIDHQDNIQYVIEHTRSDLINYIIAYCEQPQHWNELKDCHLFGGSFRRLGRIF